MSNEPEKPREAESARPPKIRAEDNPWYLLATLCGEPELRGNIDSGKFTPRQDLVTDKERARYRRAWNRYYAELLDPKTRDRLIQERGYSNKELKPLLPFELQKIKDAFAKRAIELPSRRDRVDFSNVDFGRYVAFEGYLFFNVTFENATFPELASFNFATFLETSSFKGTVFAGNATFVRASFEGQASFREATFFDHTMFTGTAFSDVNFISTTFIKEALFGEVDRETERFKFFVDGHTEPAIFSGETDFNSATFSGNTLFRNATFDKVAYFDFVRFKQEVIFTGAAFGPGAGFSSAIFAFANFESTTFGNQTRFPEAKFWFSEAKFSCSATFKSANFAGETVFTSAEFGEAIFESTNFDGETKFDRTTFRIANFRGATFGGRADFYDTTISEKADFGKVTVNEKDTFTRFDGTASFVNAEMKGETFFDGAIFDKAPPRFFNANLHQGTVWRGITWPQTPNDKDEAGEFLDAYACLKLEMDRLKKHEDELDFFALELRSRRVLLGPWLGLPIALYGLVSDYGRSYARPLYALFAVAAIGAVLLVFSGALPIEKSFGLSFANTLNVFGFRKDFFDSHVVENLPAALKILAALQTILGTILLFLVALGIRNKFRMK